MLFTTCFAFNSDICLVLIVVFMSWKRCSSAKSHRLVSIILVASMQYHGLTCYCSTTLPRVNGPLPQPSSSLKQYSLLVDKRASILAQICAHYVLPNPFVGVKQEKSGRHGSNQEVREEQQHIVWYQQRSGDHYETWISLEPATQEMVELQVIPVYLCESR